MKKEVIITRLPNNTWEIRTIKRSGKIKVKYVKHMPLKELNK